MNTVNSLHHVRACLAAGRPLLVAASMLALAPGAHARLGGFEQVEGYQPFLHEVQNYNAGQYGSGSGYSATAPVALTPGQGLWTRPVGGLNASPPAYGTGHQFYDRTMVNAGITNSSLQGMVFTTNTEGWGGSDLKLKYQLDSQDLSGASPQSTGSSRIALSFWWCTALAGVELGGALPDGFFGDEIEFMDSAGHVGFRLGLTQESSGDKVTYWNGASMFKSAIVAASSRYDRWDILLDINKQTVSADYFSFGTGTTHTLLGSVGMQTTMKDFSAMTFRTSPGVTNAKLMAVDDFSFQVQSVPEPSSLSLVGLAVLAMWRRRPLAQGRADGSQGAGAPH